MQNRKILRHFILMVVWVLPAFAAAQYPKAESELDKKVIEFLQEQSGRWRDMNVPVGDGRLLYDLVLEGNHTRALEIGTSTGHSAIWIAWALSKTKGKLVTIEIDKNRYLAAQANFKKAGLTEFIDARLANAHEMVPQLEGPFDFVFCDADKEWYKNYFVAVENKMVKGGIFAAHNTNMRTSDIRTFLDYAQNHSGFTTTLAPNSRSGLSISKRK